MPFSLILCYDSVRHCQRIPLAMIVMRVSANAFGYDSNAAGSANAAVL